jgi:D-cysteine desulfhydrase family pyridoxal phosphate-dependent enzyme
MIWKLLSFPRFKLVPLPTPLERAEKLSRELDLNIFVKRDDAMELGLSGNKVRKLEFIVADALGKGCDVLITRGATHSNHVRITAAAARKVGLDVYAVLTPPGDMAAQGNVLLDEVYGAELVFSEKREEADEVMRRLAEELRARGRRPYVIPGGGASEFGVLGYALASVELMMQCLDIGLKPRYIVHSTGTGTTQAGLTLGLKMLGIDDVKVVGITDGTSAKTIAGNAAKLLNATAEMLKLDMRMAPEDFLVYDDYGFGGYGAITKEVVETIVHVARTEGLLLDPIYTAKAMYGLIDLAHKGTLEKGSDVIFIHTGGIPALFQYASEISRYLAQGSHRPTAKFTIKHGSFSNEGTERES